MTTLRLFNGDFGGDEMIVRCNLSEASAPVEWHTGDGEWVPSQYQAADCRHTEAGLARIGKEIAAVQLESATVDCDWEAVTE